MHRVGGVDGGVYWCTGEEHDRGQRESVSVGNVRRLCEITDGCSSWLGIHGEIWSLEGLVGWTWIVG